MAASRPARPKPLDWSGPSYLKVFVRNLKLLQLDQRDDWPEITLRGLSSSSANQRQRIRLVEWALYHLFAIWDPEGTQNKLRPFFPPLEPLQSVNLRAALFRALTELKKNGDLGRETTLRKTMLDDCKGEKFDELLAVFSTAVLRKLLAMSATDTSWNSAMKLSMANAISPVDYQNILPLILAHQVSLNTAGGNRARVQEIYEQFSQLLDDKKVELSERASKEDQNSGQVQVDPEILARELRANWLGSEEWATALLDGGAQCSTDAFLELPFSQAWARATDSSVADLSTNAKQDLVVDLEARVLRLRSRLRKWHEFNDSIRKKRDQNGSSASAKPQEPRLVFRDHQPLTVASISKAVRQPADRGRVLKDIDRSFMSTVNEAIVRINGNPRNQMRRNILDENIPVKSLPVRPPSAIYQSTSASSESEAEIPLSKDSRSAYPSSMTPSPEPETLRPSASTPIVRLTPDPDLKSDEPDYEPVKASSSHYKLTERTRKSMSLVPPVQSHEPRPHQRRGPRTSLPVNQLETPRKTSEPITRSGASTPQDKLFEEDAEYASIFKSRPRVALSPISSPAVHISPELDNDGFDLDYGRAQWGDVDSPLATAKYR
ncbi:uncharacterized protein N7484_005017 [Penicillium longicatenatum]|uniref:uncharacterized protein n=1 Tax=Penicillium longicatenatum TaxID=1561947 RepID=UPI002549052D|nr:uncharacterized protein N7484_005017 [Penicillium longicatenatum]KAJ5651294.1 hypothetical protein N7484_005017 [Penicillium longicatenatum]